MRELNNTLRHPLKYTPSRNFLVLLSPQTLVGLFLHCLLRSQLISLLVQLIEIRVDGNDQ